MSSAKITQTRYFDRYGNKKVALLEEGQSIEIDSVYGFDEYHFEDIYLCKVINPSDACKNHGVMKTCQLKFIQNIWRLHNGNFILTYNRRIKSRLD